MTEFVNVPGATRTLQPQAVVLLDPATGLPVQPVVSTPALVDAAGTAFNPDACAHTFAYSAGLLASDTATDGASTWVKTYSYTAGVLTFESKWVKQ